MNQTVSRLGRGLTLVLVGATLLLPYIGGYPLAYVLMLLTLMLTAWLALARPAISIDPAGWCLIGAFGLLAFVCLVAPGNLGSAVYIINFLMLVFAIPLTTALRQGAGPGNTQRVANLALVGVAIAAVVAAFQVVVLDRDRAMGWGSDEIWSASAALAVGWLALIGRSAATGRWRHVYLLGPILGVLVVLYSGSRGPMLAVPILMLGSLVVLRRFRTEMLLVGLVMVAMFYFWPEKSRLVSIAQIGGELAAGVPLSDGSFDVRKGLLDAGWGAIKQSPLIGHGWGRFAEVTSPFTGITDWGVPHDTFHLHSDPLNFAVAGGVLGALAYLLILFAPLAAVWRRGTDSQAEARQLGAVILSGAYLGCGMANTLFGFEFHTTLYVCLLAIILGYCRDAPAQAGP